MSKTNNEGEKFTLDFFYMKIVSAFAPSWQGGIRTD